MTADTDKLTRSSAGERRSLEPKVVGSNPTGSVVARGIKVALSPLFWTMVVIGTLLGYLLYRLAKFGDSTLYAEFGDGVQFCFWAGVATTCIIVAAILMTCVGG